MFLDELLKEQPSIHEKRYLPNEFGCPKVMQETVCDEVDLSNSDFPWTRKVTDAKD